LWLFLMDVRNEAYVITSLSACHYPNFFSL
jgi:hypothetical protein